VQEAEKNRLVIFYRQFQRFTYISNFKILQNFLCCSLQYNYNIFRWLGYFDKLCV